VSEISSFLAVASDMGLVPVAGVELALEIH
jgi:hypothetical protein